METFPRVYACSATKQSRCLAASQITRRLGPSGHSASESEHTNLSSYLYVARFFNVLQNNDEILFDKSGTVWKCHIDLTNLNNFLRFSMFQYIIFVKVE